VSHTVSERTSAKAQATPALLGRSLILLAWIAAVAVLVTLRASRRRAAGPAAAPPPVARPSFGGTPETALAAASEEEMDTRLERIQCACGRAGPLDTVERSRLTNGGTPMAVVTQRCERCGDQRDLYFRFPELA
jgi:hypothetical protein